MQGIVRSFVQHSVRKQRALHGLWDFSIEDKSFQDRLTVPQCWDTTIRYYDYRGKAYYRRIFRTEGLPVCRLRFFGVSHTAQVWVDGRLVGSHFGAYTPFSVILTNLEPGEHELIVEVDNSFGDDVALYYEFYDWHIYGGIIRPVVLEELPEVFVDRVQVKTLELREEAATVSFSLFLQNTSTTQVEEQISLRVLADNLPVVEETLEQNLKPGVNTLEITKVIQNPRLWSLEDPFLYYVEVTTSGDDLRDRFGIRTIQAEGQRVLLNGVPVKLLGFNRHDDHPDWGAAVPVEIMLKDLEIVKEAGGNFLRGSHYPYPEIFLDLLDEQGILFGEECSHWGLKEGHMLHPRFLEQSKQCITEMITAHYNHPSIIIWGLLNECASNLATTRPVYEELIGHIRALDESRLVTYAGFHPGSDVCLDLVDIVSINNYTGWYVQRIDEIPTWYEGFRQWLEKIGQGNKPFILSEFGVGAVAGVRSFYKVRWSEDYQYEFFHKALEYYLQRADVTGVAVWQFCDTRTSASLFLTRPGSRNNKGVVDRFRQPKDGFYAVRDAFMKYRQKEV
ncbi:MAG TPA: beta-glucuronidase [Firmicutes bacterium]|nr:beta-glucuronidase [Bacillota bacterium]